MTLVWESFEIFHSMHTDRRFVSEMLKAGAAGFVSSPPSGDALLHAVGEVRARLLHGEEFA